MVRPPRIPVPTHEHALRRLVDACAAQARHSGRGHDAVRLLRWAGLTGMAARLGITPMSRDTRRAARLRAFHQTHLLQRAAELSAKLSADGIAHLFVNGAALMGTFYRPGDRIVSDIELHVRPPHRWRAAAALAQLGYTAVAEPHQAAPNGLRSTLGLERDGRSPVEAVSVNLHWGLAPPDRLLPRPVLPLPERVWRSAPAADGLPAPSDEHHCAIIAHHLLRSDLLHLRKLVDLVLLFDRLPSDGGAEYLSLCGDLGIRRFGGWLAGFVAREFRIERRAAVAEEGASDYLLNLSLERWIRMLLESQPPRRDGPVTAARIARRIGVLGPRAAPRLLADALFPPAAFLKWRWPRLTPVRARARHYAHALRTLAPEPSRAG